MRILHGAEAAEVPAAGGKAQNLARLASWFRVPPFVVLVGETPGDIRIPHDLNQIVKKELAGPSYAVRSSANVEDGHDASFAGIFESRLGISCEGLEAAVNAVLASATSERVGLYCETHGYRTGEILMSVVIQRMVAADRSGVCLTRRAPDEDVAVVEAVYGLGELLVSGTAEPDTYLVDRTSGRVTVSRTGYQAAALRLEADLVVRCPVPPADRSAQKLLLREVGAVANLSVAVEQRQRYDAADVEWAYEGSVLYLLQARPYAAIAGRSA